MSTLTTGNSYLDSIATSSANAAKAKSSATIDQSGFLKLLTAQLKTQDPTEPMDNNQMVAQMTGFSQLSGITEMNASLKAMAGDVAAARFGDASGWIGRAALVNSNIAAPLSNGGYAGEITLPTSAKDVTLTLLDANGQTVYAKDLGAHDSGAVSFGWDGKGSDGKVAASGPLTLVVSAVGADGKAVTPGLATWTEVQAVQSPASGTTKLTTPLGSFAPSDIQQLS